MNLNKKSKGFIGAIGDDLPSLIPIFIGLIIFFSVFLNTYNIYKEKTNLYTLEQDAITISLTLKGEPIISNYEIFQHQCDLVNTKKKWSGFLVDMPLDSDTQESLNPLEIEEQIVSFDNDSGDKDMFICNNKYKDIILKNENNFFLNNNKKIVYMFPITLQENNYAITKKLYVIVWE